MDESISEQLYIDCDEDEISFAIPATDTSVVLDKTLDLDASSTSNVVHGGLGSPTKMKTEHTESPARVPDVDAGAKLVSSMKTTMDRLQDEPDKLATPIKTCETSIGPMDCLQDEPGQLPSSADKDMLLLALQRRFEKHKVDLPNLCDLNLDDTTADDKSCRDQSVASLEFVANCSMPVFDESRSEEPMSSPHNLHRSSAWNARDLDTTAKFLELEKSCLTPTKPDEEDNRESLAELSSEDLSTVSADADGGFLTTFTSLALIHPSLNRDSVAMSPFAIVEREATAAEDFTSVARETIYTSTLTAQHEKSAAEGEATAAEDFASVGRYTSTLTALHEKSDILTDDSNADLSPNTTLDEMMMLEAYGPLYMVSEEKDMTKRGMDSFANASLSRVQQNMLDSILDQNASLKPGVMRDISLAFEPHFPALSSPLPKDEKHAAEDFQFPKPLSTVSGSNSKPKYRHQTTPMKVFSPKPAPASNSASSGIFSASPKARMPLLPPKGKFFSPVRDSSKPRTKTPASGVKMTADLKNIQSPIGHYINGSPVPCLMSSKHVPLAGLHRTKFVNADSHEEKKASENVDFNNLAGRNLLLPPQKSYESTSSLQKMTPSKSKLPMLGGKSKQLVSTPKPMVMKHTGRVKASHLPSNSPICKAARNVDDSCISEKTMEAEVSVVVTREATKTSSIK